MNNHTISVIINNYNYGRYVGKAIDSVISQTCSPSQIIVVDDGSTDNSREIIQRYGGKVDAVFKENGGQSSAFNIGFKHSVSDWVLFLDADDFLYPNAIEVLSQHLRKDISRIDFQLDKVNENGLYIGSRNLILFTGDPLELVSKKSRLHINPTSSHLFSARTLRQCLPLPEESMRICADLGLIARAAGCGYVYGLNETLGAYRIHKNNLFTSRKNLMSIESSEREILNAQILVKEINEVAQVRGVHIASDYGLRSLYLIECLRRMQIIKPNGLSDCSYLREMPARYVTGFKQAKGIKRKMKSLSLLSYYNVTRWLPLCGLNLFARVRGYLGVN